MTRLNASTATFFQAILEGTLFFLAVFAAIKLHRIHYALPELNISLPALIFSVLMVGVSGLLGLYRADRRLTFGAYFSRTVLALVVSFVAAYAAFGLMQHGELFQDSLGVITLYSLGSVVAARQVVEPSLRRALFAQRVLVLGTGQDALRLEKINADREHLRLTIVGFFPLASTEAPMVPATRILPASWSLQQAIERTQATEVIVAVREQRGGVLPINDLLNCRLAGIRVTSLAGFLERVEGRIPVASLKSSWLIYGDGFRQSWLGNTLKGASDLLACLILSSISVPVILLTALAIKLESRGPVFYRQERVGRGGKTFQIYKFRSMSEDAEPDGVARWASDNDPRITRVGQFIRRTRIDELPQLINVLKGEMSIVGPRPERPQFVRALVEQVPFYACRHAVKPGITGWAQVRFAYGATFDDAVTKLEYDLYYVKNHSLLLDTHILLDTVRVVLSGQGAR